MALATTTEPTSMGGANLISYADSDFESWSGNWVADSNASLSQDTSHAYLHDASLQDTLSNNADSKFQLGTTGLISIPNSTNMTYRVGAYFLAPTSGGTVTLALGAYSANGWTGWQIGTPVTLNDSGTWQYVSAVIPLPAGTVSVTGPRVSFSGGTGGQTLNMDEVQLNPDRAATIIGGDGGSNGNESDWAAANTAVNGTTGLQFQSDKIFYNPGGMTLPSTFSGSTCDTLPQNVVCVITYKPTDPSNYTSIDPTVTSFVESIPSSRR